MHNSYERMTFYKTPRGRSKKVRKYENVDLTKEFEFRQTQREQRKQERLEELYSSQDLKALNLKDIINVDFKNMNRKELSEAQLTALENQEAS
jgi:hypothetical protein